MKTEADKKKAKLPTSLSLKNGELGTSLCEKPKDSEDEFDITEREEEIAPHRRANRTGVRRHKPVAAATM